MMHMGKIIDVGLERMRRSADCQLLLACILQVVMAASYCVSISSAHLKKIRTALPELLAHMQACKSLLIGITPEDVLDDDDALLNHIVDFITDQFQQDIDAALCCALQGDSTLANSPDSL